MLLTLLMPITFFNFIRRESAINFLHVKQKGVSYFYQKTSQRSPKGLFMIYFKFFLKNICTKKKHSYLCIPIRKQC